MSKDYNSSVFKDLLDKLQQESWQLELLISGFAIFGLFSATSHIDVKFDIAEHDKRLVDTLLWFAAKVCCWILICNLLIHVVLRGLWIGALGLRYVSGEIDYEELNYSPKFTKFLQKRIGSFDKYIATLEDYCSILFAISFLFIFYFLASFAFIVLILIIVFIFMDNDANGTLEQTLDWIGISLILFSMLGMFLTFIDFLTQGWLKKKKWTTAIYFPFYRIFSFVTLSFLYRPLVHNFLDNKFGKRLSLILVPVYLGILYFSSMKYQDSNYLSLERNSSGYFANSGNYEDQLKNNNDFVNRVAIPSKVITDNYLKVFVKFNDKVEDRIFSYNPGLKPKDDQRGLKSTVVFTNSGLTRKERKKRDSLRLEYYKTFNDLYKLYIDNKLYESSFIASGNKIKGLGFETYLDIDTLKNGKHILKVNRNYINKKKDTVQLTEARIPFWKFHK